MPIVSSVLLPRGREERRDAVHPSRPQHRPHSTRRIMPFLLLASKSKVGKRRRASSSSSSSSSSSQKLDDDDGPREEKRRDAFVSLSFFAPFRRRQRAGFDERSGDDDVFIYIPFCALGKQTTFVWPTQKEESTLTRQTRTHAERERTKRRREGRHIFYFPS